VGAATLSTSRFSMLRPARHIDTIEHLVLLDLLGAKSPQIPSYFHPTAWLHDKVRSAQRRLLDAKAFWPPNESSRSGEDWFNGHSWGGIEDDHLPFLAGGVPVLHLIPSPFPRVWHTMGVSCSANSAQTKTEPLSLQDDASALDYGTDYGWAMIMRLFVAEYLGLGPDLAATAQPSVRDAAEQARRAQEAQREEQIRAGAAIDVEPQGPRPRDELVSLEGLQPRPTGLDADRAPHSSSNLLRSNVTRVQNGSSCDFYALGSRDDAAAIWSRSDNAERERALGEGMWRRADECGHDCLVLGGAALAKNTGGSVEGRTTALQAWPVPSEEGEEQSADVTW
jgi:hypothetical protein